MNIFEDIASEHALLEKAAGSLVTMTNTLSLSDNADLRNDIKNLCNFFIVFMTGFHSKKEEDIIFNALEKLGLPLEKGPLYYYALEHSDHLKHMEEILQIVEKPAPDDEDISSIMTKVANFCGEVWEHIDKENSVFMVEVTERVRGRALQEMNQDYENFINNYSFQDTTAVEQWQQAEYLIKKYQPVKELPDFIRGDGCMSCRFFGEGCNGIEHEWWTEHEWEDFFERNDRD